MVSPQNGPLYSGKMCEKTCLIEFEKVAILRKFILRKVVLCKAILRKLVPYTYSKKNHSENRENSF